MSVVRTLFDVIIIGAGASGLVCGAEAARRERKTLILDHSEKAAAKVLVSGGGKCNFTNLGIEAGNYLSENPHFCKSALSRYSQWDIIAALETHGIFWEERAHGQLFAIDSARDIQNMLLEEVRLSGALLKTGFRIKGVQRRGDGSFLVKCQGKNRVESYTASSLVIATGGLSFPSLGATPLGYRIAEQFGIPVIPPSPGLVPLTLHKTDKQRFGTLSGIAVEAEVRVEEMRFRENLLFTHRGLSGPVILQISNYLHPGDTLVINLLPGRILESIIEKAAAKAPEAKTAGLFAKYLPKRLITAILPPSLADKALKSLNAAETRLIAESFHQWLIKPNGTEGYRKAEVTRGGVSTRSVSSKTFEVRDVPGLYFIGEVLDVTGWLGGYNLQWAWSSGWCAGQYV